MSTSYNACIAIGFNISDLKYSDISKWYLDELSNSSSDDDVLTNDDLEHLLHDVLGEFPDYFGEYDNHWFVGYQLAKEEEVSLNDLEIAKDRLSIFQNKLNSLTKVKDLILFEVRVIKQVY